MGRIPTTVGVIPGAGLVARFGSVVIVLHGESPSTDRILGAAETAANAADPGMAIAQRLAATVFTSSTAQPPAFGVVAPTAGGILILLRGSVTATVDGPEGHRVLSGRRAMTWADEIIQDPVRRLTLSADDATREAPHSDLRAGVVPGGGVVVHAPLSGLPSQRGGDSPAKAAHAPAPDFAPPHPRSPEHRPPTESGPATQHPSGPVLTSGPIPASGPTPASGPIPASGPAPVSGPVGAPAPATGHTPAQHGAPPPTQHAATPPGQRPSTPATQRAPAPRPEHPSTPPAQHASGPAAPHAHGPASGPNADVTRRAPTSAQSHTGFTSAPSAGAEAGRVQPVSPSASDSMPKAAPVYPRNAATTPRAGGPDLSKQSAAASSTDERRDDRPDPEDQPPTAAYVPEPEVAETRAAGGPPSTSTLAGPGASLTSAEGETYPLDRPYVIGRDPMIDEAVRRAVASPIVIARDRHVSRVHARVFIEKGQVFVRDAGTPGGTYVAAPGAPDWVRVGQQPMELKAGWSLRIGERILTYRTA
ncbi:FHA domain-containing protein [Nocardia sp. NPDC056611]|uniref:FHA domain-containing protein n=1 Tax=Nocardia sp. NPDC056611 TaxID=3345877 RepID=UPI00366BAD9F